MSLLDRLEYEYQWRYKNEDDSPWMPLKNTTWLRKYINGMYRDSHEVRMRAVLRSDWTDNVTLG